MSKRTKVKALIEKFGERPFVGTLTIDVDIRLSDFMNNDKKFISVEVGKKVRIINKEYIAEVTPYTE